MAFASPAPLSGHAITTHAADVPPLSKHLRPATAFGWLGARMVRGGSFAGPTRRMGHAPFWSVLYCELTPGTIGLLPRGRLEPLGQERQHPVQRGPGGVTGLVDQVDGEHRVRPLTDAVRVAR